MFSENNLYYHAVGKISNNEKYFIRYFYSLPGKPSEDYIKYKNIYGEDLWNAEYQKIKRLRANTKILFSVEEYHKSTYDS